MKYSVENSIWLSLNFTNQIVIVMKNNFIIENNFVICHVNYHNQYLNDKLLRYSSFSTSFGNFVYDNETTLKWNCKAFKLIFLSCF